MANLANFTVVHSGMYFANNNDEMKRVRERENYVQVPFPDCPTFMFHRPDPFRRPNLNDY
jgi:hypothetical protein